jgi:hypothetical protein
LNIGIGRTWREVFMMYFRTKVQPLLRNTEENHKYCWAKYEIRDFPCTNKSSDHCITTFHARPVGLLNLEN